MYIQKTDFKTETFKVSFHFYIDVQDFDGVKNFYLYHEGYGIKEHIVGLNVYDSKKLGSTTEEVIYNLIKDEDLYRYYKNHIENGWVDKESAIEVIKADFDIKEFE
jgi:hypothetical protein